MFLMLEMTRRVRQWPATSGIGVWVVAGALVGIATHNGDGEPWSLAFALMAVWLWGRASSRGEAFATMVGYYLGSGRGLYLGTWTFFGGGTEGVTMAAGAWLGPALLMGMAWALAWGRAGSWWRAVAALIVLAVPPVGIVGWGSPLTAAGVLFPGWGVVGLALMGAVSAVAASWGEWSRASNGCRRRGAQALGVGIAGLVLLANGLYGEPAATGNWLGVDTYIGKGNEEGFSAWQEVVALGDQIGRASAPVTVFPELVGGNLAANKLFWSGAEGSLREKGRSALVGGVVLRPDGTLDNVVVVLGAQGDDASGPVTWGNRMPVPVAMWRPWAKTGPRYAAHWSADGVRQWRGERVATLICYEQLLVWPAALTVAARPDRLLAVNNLWWARDTSIPGIQLAVSRAWARLMGVPIVVARNW